MGSLDAAQRTLPRLPRDLRAPGQTPRSRCKWGGEVGLVRIFLEACRWRPREGISSLVSQTPRDWNFGVLAERTWLRRQCSSLVFFLTPAAAPQACEDRVRLNYKQTGRGCQGTRAGGAHRRAQERHEAQTSTRRAARRPPRAAKPCPPHPAAGGQCRYEEKASNVPPANRHTPDLRYCAPSIEMQTSRVRRPQSARAPGASQHNTRAPGAWLGPYLAVGSGL